MTVYVASGSPLPSSFCCYPLCWWISIWDLCAFPLNQEIWRRQYTRHFTPATHCDLGKRDQPFCFPSFPAPDNLLCGTARKSTMIPLVKEHFQITCHYLRLWYTKTYINILAKSIESNKDNKYSLINSNVIRLESLIIDLWKSKGLWTEKCLI